jgi:hypothetical protein
MIDGRRYGLVVIVDSSKGSDRSEAGIGRLGEGGGVDMDEGLNRRKRAHA